MQDRTRLSNPDTPSAMEKTSFGRFCVVSRGITGDWGGNVYVGQINTAVSCGDDPAAQPRNGRFP